MNFRNFVVRFSLKTSSNACMVAKCLCPAPYPLSSREIRRPTVYALCFTSALHLINSTRLHLCQPLRQSEAYSKRQFSGMSQNLTHCYAINIGLSIRYIETTTPWHLHSGEFGDDRFSLIQGHLQYNTMQYIQYNLSECPCNWWVPVNGRGLISPSTPQFSLNNI